MPATLKQRIWEAHPLLPRLSKLKMIKYLPIAYDRVVRVCKSLDLPAPNPYSPKYSKLSGDILTLRDNGTKILCHMYLGNSLNSVNALTLHNGRVISEHEYHLIEGEALNEHGYIPLCQCKYCAKAAAEQSTELKETIAGAFSDRSFAIHVPKEEKITDISPEKRDLLPTEFRVPSVMLPKIVKITRPSDRF
jgi:hypothetical protein